MTLRPGHTPFEEPQFVSPAAPSSTGSPATRAVSSFAGHGGAITAAAGWIGKQNDADADRGYFSSDILRQGIDVTAWRGSRIEVSANVKGKDASSSSCARRRTPASSLNDSQLPSVPQTKRCVNLFPPRGAEWERLAIVADVPLEADVVYYGVALMNGRAIWIDHVRIAKVDARPRSPRKDRPVGASCCPSMRAALPAPRNLDVRGDDARRRALLNATSAERRAPGRTRRSRAAA